MKLTVTAPVKKKRKQPYRAEMPTDAAYHFWRQVAENVAYLRGVRDKALKRLDAEKVAS